jgi:Rad3-related DNA helicase
MVEQASDGCQNEVAEPKEGRRNYLKLCEKCLAKYKDETVVPREHVAATDTHTPMPELCYHGQKEHQCRVRPPCDFNPAKT